MNYKHPDGRTMHEAVEAGDCYQLETLDGKHHLTFPGCAGLEETLHAARKPRNWGHRVGETIRAYRVLPGSRIGCMLLESAGEVVL